MTGRRAVPNANHAPSGAPAGLAGKNSAHCGLNATRGKGRSANGSPPAAPKRLTAHQRAILAVIRTHAAEPLSLRKICKLTEIASPSYVHRVIDALIARGRVRVRSRFEAVEQ